MLSLPKIIAPVDFSERSPGAARYAGRMACHFHSELTLLHVLDSGSYEVSAYEFTGPLVSALPVERRREAEPRLANFLPDEFRNMNVRRIVLSGDPAGEIVEFAHSERASLIVIPTHGNGPFRRFILARWPPRSCTTPIAPSSPAFICQMLLPTTCAASARSYARWISARRARRP